MNTENRIEHEKQLAANNVCSLCSESLANRHYTAMYCSLCSTRIIRYNAHIRPLQSLATTKVGDAIKSGKLPKLSGLKCVDCGLPAKHYDHRDYRKPLCVDPVCTSCNTKRGAASPYKRTKLSRQRVQQLYQAEVKK